MTWYTVDVIHVVEGWRAFCWYSIRWRCSMVFVVVVLLLWSGIYLIVRCCSFGVVLHCYSIVPSCYCWKLWYCCWPAVIHCCCYSFDSSFGGPGIIVHAFPSVFISIPCYSSSSVTFWYHHSVDDLYICWHSAWLFSDCSVFIVILFPLLLFRWLLLLLLFHIVVPGLSVFVPMHSGIFFYSLIVVIPSIPIVDIVILWYRWPVIHSDVPLMMTLVIAFVRCIHSCFILLHFILVFWWGILWYLPVIHIQCCSLSGVGILPFPSEVFWRWYSCYSVVAYSFCSGTTHSYSDCLFVVAFRFYTHFIVIPHLLLTFCCYFVGILYSSDGIPTDCSLFCSYIPDWLLLLVMHCYSVLLLSSLLLIEAFYTFLEGDVVVHFCYSVIHWRCLICWCRYSYLFVSRGRTGYILAIPGTYMRWYIVLVIPVLLWWYSSIFWWWNLWNAVGILLTVIDEIIHYCRCYIFVCLLCSMMMTWPVVYWW
jgi:hypothetical protein